MKELRIKYFDTIPPCTSICVLKTGFLFAASEFGNHALYQFLVSLPLHLSRCDVFIQVKMHDLPYSSCNMHTGTV